SQQTQRESPGSGRKECLPPAAPCQSRESETEQSGRGLRHHGGDRSDSGIKGSVTDARVRKADQRRSVEKVHVNAVVAFRTAVCAAPQVERIYDHRPAESDGELIGLKRV